MSAQRLNVTIVAGWLERWCGVSEFECSILAKGKVNVNSWGMNGDESWGNEFYNLKINKYGVAIYVYRQSSHHVN